MAVKCSSCNAENEGWVPETRLSSATQARDLAQQELADAKAQLGEVDGLRAQITDLKADLGEKAIITDILRAGITSDEGISVAQALYASMGADKGSAAEWLTGDLPAALRVYLPSEETPEATTPPPVAQEAAPSTQPAQPVPAQPAPPPPSRGQVPNGAPSDGGITVGAIHSMTDEEYRANRESIFRD